VFKKWLHDDTAPVLVTAANVIGDLWLSADPAVVTESRQRWLAGCATPVLKHFPAVIARPGTLTRAYW
jgi:hypothetical protein